MVKLSKSKVNLLIFIGLISSSVIAKSLESIESASYSKQRLATEVCAAVKNDELAKLRKILKDAKSRLINIYDDAKCQGVEIYEYAVLNRAEKVKQYILTRAGVELTSKESSQGKVAVVGKYIQPTKSE